MFVLMPVLFTVACQQQLQGQWTDIQLIREAKGFTNVLMTVSHYQGSKSNSYFYSILFHKGLKCDYVTFAEQGPS